MERSRLIDRALRYVERHLKDALALEDIAEEANYSPWHFHRLFYAAAGNHSSESPEQEKP